MKAGIGITAILLSGLVLFSCMSNEQTQETLENSTPETVDLLVSLGGSSRAERFLGTFDEIEKLTLDIERNFDGREVARIQAHVAHRAAPETLGSRIPAVPTRLVPAWFHDLDRQVRMI